jgi:hypothetical protein
MSAIMKPVLIKIKSGIIVTLLSFSLPSFAEEQIIQVSKQSQAKINTPTLGQSMSKIEELFGQPLERSEAIGKPPITKWRYSEFTVYFEHDKVIHSVIHRS